MKKITVLVLCLGLVAVTAGCQNTKSRAVEGATIGGILGAAAGGIIGHQSRHGVEGAAIGAATGAVAGAVVGSQIEKPQAQAPAEPVAPAAPAAGVAQSGQIANPNQMTIQQIVDLTSQGINEDVIIDKIRLSNSKFNLTVVDIDYLREQGVAQKVIDTMLSM